MPSTDRDRSEWVKASKSTPGAECVELRRQGRTAEVRDSKDPEGPRLRVSETTLAAWLAGARRGEFDPLAVF